MPPLRARPSRFMPPRDYSEPAPSSHASHAHKQPNPESLTAEKRNIQSTPHPSSTTPRPQHEAHANRIRGLMAYSIADSTAANYESAIKAFSAFCSENELPDLPTSEFTLCAFVAHLAESKAGSSIRNTISGLKHWHDRHGESWPGGPKLDLVIRGAANVAPASSTKPDRDPVTTGMIEELAIGLDMNDEKDITVFAAATIAFYGMARLGELLGCSSRKHDPSRFPSRNSVGPPISANGSREIHLPRTKTSQRTGESIIITRQAGPTNPIAAIERLLSSNRTLHGTDFLFAYTDKHNKATKNLTSEAFLTRVNDIWSRSDHPRITGHSFRIGGTTHLLHSGIAPEVVRMMGRWASDAHFRYWRDKQSIAINHVEDLTTKAPASGHSLASPPTTTGPRTAYSAVRRKGDRAR
ncbi:site specific recombinase, phage integrase family protein, partial [Rhizoctonia solani AG-3 Rhs1AP]